MRRTCLVCLALALAAATGCKSRSDLVEAELRTKDRQLREARGELMRAEAMNEALENTLKEQRCAQPVLRPGPGASVKDVQLGRGTGGIDEDKVPGDEGLQVVLVPRDVDGSAVKAAGSLRVTALEITPEGLKAPLSTWDVSALQLRRSWRSGLLSTGYFIALPWQRLPSTERLRLVATFLPLEGGAFEAERDVTVRLLAEPHRHQPPLAPPTPQAPPAGLAPPVPLETPVGPPPRPDTPTLPPPEPLPGAPTPGAAPSTPGGPWLPAAPTASLLPPRPIP
jgi:hypothetical protein